MSATLPIELAGLHDHLANFSPASDLRSVCGLHGPQSGPSCVECDKFFPEAVEQRKVAIAQIAGGPGFVSITEVQRMIQEAIQNERSFNAWKAQQALEAAKQSAEVTTPPSA